MKLGELLVFYCRDGYTAIIDPSDLISTLFKDNITVIYSHKMNGVLSAEADKEVTIVQEKTIVIVGKKKSYDIKLD